MYPEEFIYFPFYNQQEITNDLIPVEQPWCKNLIVADIINEKIEFRHGEAITLARRRVQDYEYKILLKKIREKIEFLQIKM